MTGLNDLPDELIDLIIRRCEGYLTLGSICHVNRRLRRIAEPQLDHAARFELRVFGTGFFETSELVDSYRTRPDVPFVELPFGEEPRDEVRREYWKYGDVRLAWLSIIHLLDEFCERPILFRYIRHVALNFESYPKPDMPNRYDGRLCLCTDCALIGKYPVTPRLRRFGQRALRRLGVPECIDAWDTPDGWTALFLLLCHNLESLYVLNTDHPTLVRTRMAQIAEIAMKQTPHWSLARLKYVNACEHEFRLQELSRLLWTFMVLPSIQTCDFLRQVRRYGPLLAADEDHTADVSFPEPGVIRVVQQDPTSVVPLPLLRRKILSFTTPLRKFRYFTYANGNNATFPNGTKINAPPNIPKEARINFRLLGNILADFHNSLEELWIVCPYHIVAPPDLDTLDGDRFPFNGSNAHLDFNPNSMLGSLAQFKCLDTICVPIFTMFHDQNPLFFIDLIPKGIEILEFSGGPAVWQMSFFYALENLVHAKYERFPNLRLIRLHGYVLPDQAVEMCRSYGITLRMDKTLDQEGSDHPYLT